MTAVLDEAQLVSQTNSVAAQMAAHLWRRHAWVVTGTPISSSINEVNGLLDFLAHDFGNKDMWRTMIQEPFKDQSPTGLCRMRSLLRDVVLRRTKRQPYILKQMNLPPLTWHPLTMPLAPLERKAYEKSAAALARSFNAFKPVIDGDRQGRVRKRAITGGGGGGFDGKNAAAKQSARFIGDVTRLRQTACHPQVRTAHLTAVYFPELTDSNDWQIVRRSDSMLGGKRLTMQEIMGKLIERERSAACAAEVSCLRAQMIEAIVSIAPPTPTKASRSEAVYLALWDAEKWGKVGGALDELEEKGVAVQKAQRVQRRSDLAAESEQTHKGAGSIPAESQTEQPQQQVHTGGDGGVQASAKVPKKADGAAAAASAADGGDDTDVTKAWAKLRTEITALRKFIASQAAAVTAAAAPVPAAEPAAAQSSDSKASEVAQADGTEQPAVGVGGSRPGATSAASRRARSRTAPPKLFQSVLSLIRRPDGGKSASTAVVSREQRRAAALGHSLIHLRARATEAKEQNVQREAAGKPGGKAAAGSTLERQCPICLDGLDCAWTVTPCGHEFCNECIATHLDGTLAVASTPGRPCPVCRTPLRSSELFVVKGGAEETGGLVDEFGTKLSRMVDEVNSALAAGEKCVIFSAWARLLHLKGHNRPHPHFMISAEVSYRLRVMTERVMRWRIKRYRPRAWLGVWRRERRRC